MQSQGLPLQVNCPALSGQLQHDVKADDDVAMGNDWPRLTKLERMEGAEFSHPVQRGEKQNDGILDYVAGLRPAARTRRVSFPCGHPTDGAWELSETSFLPPTHT